MTVHALSERTGVSVRALRYYDRIGLLPPAAVSPAGYRLYDEGSLARLQCALVFRELQFPLKDIRAILDGPMEARNRALRRQIEVLEGKIEHLQNLVELAKGVLMIGMKNLDFTAYDAQKLDEYARQAKVEWGPTPAYREYEEKAKGRSAGETRRLAVAFMALLAGFGALREEDPAGETARAKVRELQAFITEHYYTCTDEILRSLGRLYAGGGSMTENIDRAGGPGTAVFAAKAIEAFVGTE